MKMPENMQVVQLKDDDELRIIFPATQWVGKLIHIFLRGVLKSPLPIPFRVKRGRGQRRSRRNRR